MTSVCLFIHSHSTAKAPQKVQNLSSGANAQPPFLYAGTVFSSTSYQPVHRAALKGNGVECLGAGKWSQDEKVAIIAYPKVSDPCISLPGPLLCCVFGGSSCSFIGFPKPPPFSVFLNFVQKGFNILEEVLVLLWYLQYLLPLPPPPLQLL